MNSPDEITKTTVTKTVDELTDIVVGRGLGYRVECPTCGAVGPLSHSPLAAAEEYINGMRP